MNTPQFTNALRAFTPADYMSYSGAEPFSNGALPLIGERAWVGPTASFEGTEIYGVATVLCDPKGVEVHGITADGDVVMYKYVTPASEELMRVIATGLPLTLSANLMSLLGFMKIG